MDPACTFGKVIRAKITGNDIVLESEMEVVR
jgi:hypothetical protein